MKNTLGYAKLSNGKKSWSYLYFVKQSWGAERHWKLLNQEEAEAKLTELLTNSKLIIEKDHPKFHSWEFEA